MRLSRYFAPLLKEDPSEADTASHRLMLRSGMVRRASAGIYVWLPLGKRVLSKVEGIVREEMDAAGAVEVLMPTLQSASLWEASGRYEEYGEEMLRIKDRRGGRLLYGPTNEEQITEVVGRGVRSYKELPLNLYHIQWKFRDELRPRFGVMRGREFLMKDGYSFDVDEAGGRASYARMFSAYLTTFGRLGVKAFPATAGSGPIGGEMSHEFLITAPTGESEVWCDGGLLEKEAPGRAGSDEEALAVMEEWTSLYAAADDERDAAEFERRVPEERRVEGRGIEVGHVFFFGDKYSSKLGAKVTGASGEETALLSGSYGIGVSRLVGAIAEATHDERGLCWPESVAPFRVMLSDLRAGSEETKAMCEEAYEKLGKAGVEVLLDDAQGAAGEKFAKMDLLGIPWQAASGPRAAKKGRLEVRRRESDGGWEETDADGLLRRLGL